MKVFEAPEIQVIKFDLQDILTTSSGGGAGGGGGDSELPVLPDPTDPSDT